MFYVFLERPPPDFTALDYLIRSGRAVLYPILKGTYERRDERGHKIRRRWRQRHHWYGSSRT